MNRSKWYTRPTRHQSLLACQVHHDSPNSGVTSQMQFFSRLKESTVACGTGTSAEMRCDMQKACKDDEEITCEALSVVVSTVVWLKRPKSFSPAIIPTIRGSAYITGIQQFVHRPARPVAQWIFVGPSSKWERNSRTRASEDIKNGCPICRGISCVETGLVSHENVSIPPRAWLGKLESILL